jgi:hypothetical protein
VPASILGKRDSYYGNVKSRGLCTPRLWVKAGPARPAQKGKAGPARGPQFATAPCTDLCARWDSGNGRAEYTWPQKRN